MGFLLGCTALMRANNPKHPPGCLQFAYERMGRVHLVWSPAHFRLPFYHNRDIKSGTWKRAGIETIGPLHPAVATG